MMLQEIRSLKLAMFKKLTFLKLWTFFGVR